MSLPPVKTRIAPAVCPRSYPVTKNRSRRSVIQLLSVGLPEFFCGQYLFLVRQAPFASSAYRRKATITEPVPAIARTRVWVLFS